jgi:hypothetical protein
MNRALGFAALEWLAFTLPADLAVAQASGPIDTRPGGITSGPAAVLPDARTAPRLDNNPAPSGYTASRTTCYKDGKVVDRAYCESDSFYRPDRQPSTTLDINSQRCSNTNTTFNPVTNSYIGYDGLTRYCR